jgi:aspartyl protease family protein
MLTVTWLVVLGLLTVFFNHWLDKERNPNQQIKSQVMEEGVRTLVLQRNRYGHYVASGSINGEPVEFLLDTGATDVSIPVLLAERLELKRGIPVTMQTANGTVTTYTTVLENVALGGIVLHDVRANINPGDSADEILLGMSFLKHLEFTQRGDTLIIKEYLPRQ